MERLAVRLALVTLLGVSLAAAGTVLWRHYSGLVDAKAELTAKAAGLAADLAGEKALAASLERQVGVWDRASQVQAQAIGALAEVQLQSTAYQRELKSVLSKHDLGALAKERPTLIEGRINAGTARALGLLERASRAPADSGADAPAAGPDASPTPARKP
jgi:hypothetical protein